MNIKQLENKIFNTPQKKRDYKNFSEGFDEGRKDTLSCFIRLVKRIEKEKKPTFYLHILKELKDLIKLLRNK